MKPLEYEIPQKYDENYITVLVRDPASLFTYWEVNEDRRRIISGLLKKEWEKISFYLRLYEVTGLNFDGTNAHRYQDFSINQLAKNWYLKELASNRSYCIDLGAKDDDGLFFVIVRSNIVRTPRMTVADAGEGELVMTYIRQQYEKDDVIKANTSSSTYYQ